MLFRINVNGISNVPIDNLTDEQFQSLCEALNNETKRRARERQNRADVLATKIHNLCKQAESEGFTLVYDDENFEYTDFWVRA